MTSTEMRYWFLLLYNRIADASAPEYNDLEMSEFLTAAQLNIVKARYNPLSNKYNQGFESSEKRRADLEELVRNAVIYNTASVFNSDNHLNARFWGLPDDFMFAISEEALVSFNPTTCTYSNNDTLLYGDQKNPQINGINVTESAWNTYIRSKLRVTVKPITHDQYRANVRNPYKKPYVSGNDGLVWRLDYYSMLYSTGNKYTHELITDGNFNVLAYYLRYLKYPTPIITANLGTRNVEGISVQTDCELNPILHREIVAEAVRLATGANNDQIAYQFANIESTKTE